MDPVGHEYLFYGAESPNNYFQEIRFTCPLTRRSQGRRGRLRIPEIMLKYSRNKAFTLAQMAASGQQGASGRSELARRERGEFARSSSEPPRSPLHAYA